MAIRKILCALAIGLALLGSSQLAFAKWWIARSHDIAYSPSFYLWGLPGLLFGVILLLAVLERAVGLRAFLTLLALLLISGGALLLATPDNARSALEAILFNRPEALQVFVIWASGIIRILVAIVIIYALARPPLRESAEPSQPQRVPPEA